MAPEYFLVTSKGEQNVGFSRLPSVVTATVDVFSMRGGQECSLQNALVLGAAANSASEAGSDKEETQVAIQQAYELGKKIGMALKENRGSDKKSQVTYTQRG